MENINASKEVSNTENPLTNISELIEVTGVVKWFDIARGFGFFAPDDDSLGDVLLHVTCLRRDGYQTIFTGSRIIALVQKRERGYQAFKILSMENKVSENSSSFLTSKDHIEIVQEEDVEKVVVKWFDRIRGFGFLMRENSSDDIFIHMETLRKYGIAGLYPKQEVLVRLDRGEKGLMAVEIHPDVSATLFSKSH
ncbi:cold-shock protein [Candidatus Liberibacter sp.]|uniref:cold-shock protein n=1 Tax=Candidatus Liberibacter sp. TaxID=34022 RepID=UPI0015F536B6|nr:cold shock protein [Candidatus Liberibacter sp.]MBA5723719.1 CspA family cold shock protein [Candidatus Liberibacter sp.]